MKKIILLYCLLFSISGFCQILDSTKSAKIKIGISFSPDYCYRSIKADASSQWLKEIKDTVEIPKFGYTTGINAIYSRTEKFAIETGIFFSDKGYKTTTISFGNTPSGELPTSSKLIYHYYFLDVPLRAIYSYQIKKIKLFLSAGVSANILLYSKTTTIFEYGFKDAEKTESTVDSGFTRVTFSGVAGLGMEYKINNKFNFKLEPIYRRSLTPLVKAPVSVYLYSMGLNVGVYYNLK